MKAFSFSEWLVKGVLIAIAFMATYIVAMFVICSILYWLQVKGYLIVDAIKWIF
jgi:hypothetical protein